MSYSLLSFFNDEKISATPILVDSVVNASGFKEETETEQASIRGLFYNRSLASRLFNASISEDVESVFITESGNGINKSYRMIINEEKYDVETSDNIAGFSDVWLIGLKVKR